MLSPDPEARERLHQARAVRGADCLLPVDRPAQDPDKRQTPQPAKEFFSELRAARAQSCREQRKREARNGWTQTTHEPRDSQPAEYLVLCSDTSAANATEAGVLPWQGAGPWRVRSDKRRIVEPMPAPGPLADLLAQFQPSEHWSPRLVYAVMTRAQEPLADRTLSQIAGRYVPQYITTDALGMILCTVTTRTPGRGQQTIESMARLLLDVKKTEAALAQWRERFAAKQKAQPYALPAPELLDRSLQNERLKLAA